MARIRARRPNAVLAPAPHRGKKFMGAKLPRRPDTTVVAGLLVPPTRSVDGSRSLGYNRGMNTIYLVLAGNKERFRICAAFDMAPHAKSYAAAFKHHAEPLWVEEVPEGLDQDFRVGDKPYVVRFNRKGEFLGV